MDSFKLKLLRQLKARCSEISEEFSEVDGLFNQAVPLFCAAVDLYCKENSIENPLNQINEEEKEDQTRVVTDNIKSVYRKIAIQTHPDKGIKEDHKVDLYKDASKAKKNNETDKLISIAKDLKIDISDLNYSDIRSIELSISETEQKITKMRSSYPWVWFFSTVKKRQDIISRFVLNKV